MMQRSYVIDDDITAEDLRNGSDVSIEFDDDSEEIDLDGDLDEFAANVEKVGIDDVRRAFAKHVDPARMVTVVVGADEKSLAAGAK